MEREAKKKKKTIIYLISGIIGIVGLIIVVFLTKNASSSKNNKNNRPNKTPPIPAPHQEEQDDCPYNEISMTITPEDYIGMKADEKELIEWRKISRDYITKLWKKGYHWYDIIQLWKWKLEAKDIPDLKAEKRIGVVNCLAVTFDLDGENDYIGLVHKVVVICRKINGGGPKIDLDENQKRDLPMTSEDYIDKLTKYRKEMVSWAGQEKNINLQNWEIFILNSFGADCFQKEKEIAWGRVGGKSAGSALYLATLSALTKKPISAQVAATGAIAEQPTKGKINDQEIVLAPGTNLPISGLKEKVIACTKKGINEIVLSKYQSSPNLLSLQKDLKIPQEHGVKIIKGGKWEPAQDFQELISSEIKAKITTHWTENINDLKELLLEGKLS